MQSPQFNPTHADTFAIEDDTIANPGAGNPADYACPANARIELLAYTCTISAIAVNIHPTVQIRTAGGTSMTMAWSSPAIQNLHTETVSASQLFFESIHLTTDDILQYPLPTGMILQPGETLRFTCNNLPAPVEIKNLAFSFRQWIIA